MMIKINKKVVNRMIQLLIIITLFSACKSISYQSAKLSNEDKFYGEKEENALLMVDMKDLSQLVEDISNLTEEKAYAKDIYDFGKSVVKDHKKLQNQLHILAFKKRAKLPTAVKEENQEIYRNIHKISDRKTFDRVYMVEMKKALQMLADMSDDFMEDSKDTQIRNFVNKHSGLFKSEIKRIDTMQEYIEKPYSEILSNN